MWFPPPHLSRKQRLVGELGGKVVGGQAQAAGTTCSGRKGKLKMTLCNGKPLVSDPGCHLGLYSRDMKC